MMKMDIPVLWSVAVLCAATLEGIARKSPLPDTSDLPEVSALHPSAGLPDPLVLFNGTKVLTRKQWVNERRPELKRLFQHYMYGWFPPPPGKVKATVDTENRQFLDGKATLREVTIRFGRVSNPAIHLLLVVPNHRTKPAPVFLGITFCGNHAVVNDPGVRIPDGWMYPGPGVVNNRATPAGRGSQVDTWNIEQSIDRGYAVATVYNGDIEPDVPDSPDGIRAKYGAHGASDRHAWGAIAAWAWGMQRAVDYLITVPDIDRKRIGVVGHSRNGKAALLAAAFDERIALAIPLQAGCGGTAPSRGRTGESVKQINDSFPHWFDGEFKQFNGRPELLPFDQNCLVALMAPRPVLFSNATEDSWANPAGQFDVLRAADPVYRFMGVERLESLEMPPPGKLINSRLGYFIRPGKHSMTRQDWQAFLDFADANLRGERRENGAR